MLSIAIDRAELHANYMVLCNHKFVLNIMLCLFISIEHMLEIYTRPKASCEQVIYIDGIYVTLL